MGMKKHRRKCRRLGVCELPDINVVFFAHKKARNLFSRETAVNSDSGARNAGTRERWKENT